MPPPALEAIDFKILKALRRDGRIPIEKLAEQVGLSASRCLRRVRTLEKAEVSSLAIYPITNNCLKTKLTRLECVRSFESSFALGQVKVTNALPLAPPPSARP